ncbi:MAG: response regulator [Chitinophagaceae bacterium]|jgi:DNA-binding response OmpR family regulator
MKNILLIDDDEIIQKILLKILQQKGYNAVYGVDGRDGLSKIDLMPYDLIITDIMMPYLNGFELIQEFKKHNNTKNAKLIVISSITHEASILDALNVDIDLFIPKPIVIDHFIQEIQKLLN